MRSHSSIALVDLCVLRVVIVVHVFVCVISSMRFVLHSYCRIMPNYCSQSKDKGQSFIAPARLERMFKPPTSIYSTSKPYNLAFTFPWSLGGPNGRSFNDRHSCSPRTSGFSCVTCSHAHHEQGRGREEGKNVRGDLLR